MISAFYGSGGKRSTGKYGKQTRIKKMNDEAEGK